MAGTAVIFASGVATGNVAVTAGITYAKISPSASATGVQGTITVEVSVNGTWVPMTFIDGNGRPRPYALTDECPSIFVPGVFAVDILRLNAKAAKSAVANFANQVFQYV
jgi:hypothetical protein